MNKKKIIVFYLLMLLAHVAHIFEEVWGRFWLLNKFGIVWYLAINWILLCIPVVLFFFVLSDKPWAYKLSIVYAGIMGLQGIGHNIGTIITGRYFYGFAGGYSGILLLIISLPMINYLFKGFRSFKLLV